MEENHRGNLERSHRAIFCDSRPCDCAGRVGLKKTALTAPTCRATGAILTRAAGGMITASGVTPSSKDATAARNERHLVVALRCTVAYEGCDEGPASPVWYGVTAHTPDVNPVRARGERSFQRMVNNALI